MTKAIPLARLAARSTFALAILLVVLPHAVAADDEFAPAFMMDMQVDYALTANLQELDPATTGDVSIMRGKPIATQDIDSNICAPGQLVIDFRTGDLTCEWAVAE